MAQGLVTDIFEIVKENDTPRTNNTAADDDELFLLGIPAGRYGIVGNIHFDAGAGTFKMAMRETALDVIDRLHARGTSNSGSSIATLTSFPNISTSPFVAHISSNFPSMVEMRGGLVTNNVADYYFYWAQQTTNATPTILKAGSWMRFLRFGDV